MPIIINDGLPAFQELVNENIFVLNHTTATHQDIRPLKIAILNLMPKKIETELQFLRLLSNCPLQIDIELLHPTSHKAKNTSQEHLSTFYKSFADVESQKFDGLIVTGAPIENLPFEQVDYWTELSEILQWSDENVYSTLHICWGAQAGLYYHYGIPKYNLPAKKFGVFRHQIERTDHALLRGFDDHFYCCHSRHTEVRREDIEAVKRLEILSASEESGINIAADRSGRRFFIFGHFEYDRYTLHTEYVRDIERGLDIQPPCNYYPDDNSVLVPIIRWKAHANQLFSNWLNYYVYQETPYNTEQINKYLEFSGKKIHGKK